MTGFGAVLGTKFSHSLVSFEVLKAHWGTKETELGEYLSFGFKNLRAAS